VAIRSQARSKGMKRGDIFGGGCGLEEEEGLEEGKYM
jgi:hypothetical protein